MASRLLLIGVAGCGKSVVGANLAARLGMTYVDGDDLHLPANIEKMRRGIPLDDDDRWPWLKRVAQTLAEADKPVVIACSALKRRYRTYIREEVGRPIVIIHLYGSTDVIGERLRRRQGHFMPPYLLRSQFAAFEPPEADEHAIQINIDQSIEVIVETIVAKLGELEV